MIDYVNQENLHQENPLLNLIETTVRPRATRP